MKTTPYIVCLAGLILFMAMCKPADPGNTEAGTEIEIQSELPDWFNDAKFGMFIHWGPYSVLGGEWKGQVIKQGDIAEWIMQIFKIPVEEYREIAAGFNPVQFDAKEWVALAKSTGMKYIIITSKHHDGFAMYDSKVSDYNIVDYTPFGRDPIKELADECARNDIKFCVYYSHREDWNHPYAYGNTWDYDSSQTNLDVMDYPDLFRQYLDQKAIPQLNELLTNYGPMGIVWFDRGMYTQEQGKEFYNLVHELQPKCLVNGRVGHYDKELLGDYQSMTDNGMPIGGIEEYWETPQTLNDTWGYSKSDHNWKSSKEIIRRLVTIVSKGGNYLLNIGPTGEGVIPEPSVKILNDVGQWMQTNKESIYGTSPSPFKSDLPWGECTRKGNKLYLHVFDWPADGNLVLEGLNNKLNSAYLLVDPENPLRFEKQKNWSISLPEVAPDQDNTVVVAEIEGDPDVDPFIIRQNDRELIKLDYLSAETFGRAKKRFNRKGEEGHFHISKMYAPEDKIEWQVELTSSGTYHVDLSYAAISGWEDGIFIVESGKEKIQGKVHTSQGFYEYKTERIGSFKLEKAGMHTFKIYPKNNLDHYLMYFKSIDLIPEK